MSKRKILFIIAILVALTTLGFSQYQFSQFREITKHTQSKYSSLEKKLDEVKDHQLRIEKDKTELNIETNNLTSKINKQEQDNKQLTIANKEIRKKIDSTKKDIHTLKTRIRNNKKLYIVSRGSSSGSTTKTINMEATGYTSYCAGCSGTTATGINLSANPNAKIIAVDPSIIPLGTKVWVEGYGYATAADTGGAIHGNKIDMHFANTSQANAWGRRTVLVKILK